MATACWCRARCRARRVGVWCAVVLAIVLVGGAGWEPDRAFAGAKRFVTWLPLAEAGDAEAQCHVGVAYINGNQVPQDFHKGLAWLVRSSDAGYSYARFVLADVYSRGYAGLPVNNEKAYYYASLAVASRVLPEKYRDRSVKIRDASAKLLTRRQIATIQAMTARAVPDAAASGS